MNGIFVLFGFLIGFNYAYGQSDVNWPSVEYEGKMLQIKLEPAGKNLKVFVTGYEAAAITFDDLQIEASVGLGESKKYFTVDRKKDFFFIKNESGERQFNLRLKVKGEDTGEKEVSIP